MSVLLVGIGADTTNCSPTPPIYEDGRFEYVPIPERCGPTGTTERRTYGNTELQHTEAALASIVEAIYPEGRSGPRLTDADLRSWPLHFDPNLVAFTYGETASRAAYISRLRQLEPGDLVAFYTGLQSERNAPRHRYVIGAFTVEKIVDFRRITRDGTRVAFRELPEETRNAMMEKHAANAHAKRYFANDEIVATDDGLVVVDGREPGGRLHRAMRISKSADGPHHYLRDDLESRWRPAPNGRSERNAYLGGVKPAHLLDVAPETFLEDLDPYR